MPRTHVACGSLTWISSGGLSDKGFSQKWRAKWYSGALRGTVQIRKGGISGEGLAQLPEYPVQAAAGADPPATRAAAAERRPGQLLPTAGAVNAINPKE